MARVIFFTWPISAAVGSGVKLAHDLSARGHQVSYLGVADCAQYVAVHGFPFTPLYETWLPATTVEDADADRNFIERIQEARAMVRKARELLDAIGADREREFQDIMARIRPDLLIIYIGDFESIIPSLLAYESGVKSVYLYDNYGRSEDPIAPPVTTSIIPANTWLSPLRVRLAWKTLKLRRRVAALFGGLTGLSFETDIYRTSRRIASRCDYPDDCIESTDATPFKARLPEIVLCPRELDFPHRERPGRHYVDSSIDLNRREADFPWDRLEPGRRLIYCALGTLVWRDAETYRRFFKALIEVAAITPSSQWVIALYDILDPADFSNVPPNVILVKRAPQLALLQKCGVAIVHGGTNTIKECAYFGVPMIVFPLGFDHPGNAARVIYHGLGVRADFSTITATELNALIDRVERDPFIKAQTLVMREKLRKADGARPAVDCVEMLLASQNAQPLDEELDDFGPCRMAFPPEP